jgi:hypothetical protein
MDLRRLRTFVAVAELGTVSKAALRLRGSLLSPSRSNPFQPDRHAADARGMSASPPIATKLMQPAN